MGLADVPFYGAFQQRRQQIEQEPTQQLQQASAAVGLQGVLQQQAQAKQMQDLLSQTGGDAEKALAAALQTGNITAAQHLAPIVKLQQEQRQREETPKLLAGIMQPQQQSSAPQTPVAPDFPTASPSDAMVTPQGTAPTPQDARKTRVAQLDKLMLIPQYANNPVVMQRLSAERDRLTSIKPMVEHNFSVGNDQVQPHISYDEGKTWQPIQGSQPSAKFAKQVAPVSSGDSALSDDDAKFMAGQYLAGDRTVMQNLGRGQQGSDNIVKIRREIRKQAIEAGAGPRDVAAAIGEFEGFKSGQRALGTRQAQIELAGNVTAQFAPLAVEASEKFDRTEFKTLNDVEKSVLNRTASPELRRFNFANTSLINAYARAVNPSGASTVSDKDHAREILDTGFSKGDYRAAVQQLQLEIQAELKAPGSVKAGMRNFLTSGGEGAPAPAPVAPPIPKTPPSQDQIDQLLKKYGR